MDAAPLTCVRGNRRSVRRIHPHRQVRAPVLAAFVVLYATFLMATVMLMVGYWTGVVICWCAPAWQSAKRVHSTY